jgi:hypothetical protein
MAQKNREYSKLRRKFLTDNSICRAKISKCTVVATDVHHMRGRGIYHLDVDTWLPVCRNCHTWIENNPVDAKELGFSISRTQNQQDE